MCFGVQVVSKGRVEQHNSIGYMPVIVVNWIYLCGILV